MRFNSLAELARFIFLNFENSRNTEFEDEIKSSNYSSEIQKLAYLCNVKRVCQGSGGIGGCIY